MAFAQETLCPTPVEMAFIRKEALDEGKSIVFYFQSPTYIDEFNLELPVEQVMSNVTDSEFKGNIKFKITAEQLVSDKYNSLKGLKPYSESKTTVLVRFGFSPQSISGSGVSYAKTKFIKLYENWQEFYKELKEQGKITAPARTAAAAGATA